jgi:putative FmdB family regulatory protein
MIYEYQCKKCGVFEVLQSNYEALNRCPSCKSRIHKLVSLSSFQLKGEGWTKKELLNYKVEQIEKKLEIEEQEEDRNIAKARKKKVDEIMQVIKDKTHLKKGR